MAVELGLGDVAAVCQPGDIREALAERGRNKACSHEIILPACWGGGHKVED